MKKFSAAAMGIGLGVLGIAASRALLPQAPTAPAGASVNVTQHHNNASRDGLFIDPAFTFSAAANLARDVSFDGTIVGNVYAQPLYVEGGPDQRAKVIAVTESNNVYALDAITGAIIWQRNVGTPAGSMGLISPVGITGTPVIDLVSRSLFLIAVISGPNNMFYSLNVDTGAINPGFPIDVNATFPDFSSSLHMQRGALVLLGNMIYIPYGGYADIGNYQGRVLGISLDGTQFGEWVATSLKSGIWTPGGIASDGTNLYIATGNAPGGTTPWGGSEAIVRLQPGPVFSGSTTDYWAPTNWQSLDGGDVDLGGSNPIIVDVPGAIPSALVVAIGKDRNGYLIDRANLGGIIAPVNQAVVSSGQVINSPATYRTNQGTFVVLRPPNGTLTAFKITATNPPTIATGWTATATGRTSPFVTSTDGTNNTIVWAYGHGTNQRLFGYNGETGVQIFAGGGANDTISGTRTFTTGIAARGRIYIAGDNKVFAFSVPTGATPTPSPTPTASPTPTPSPTATSTTTPCASPTCGPSCFPKVQCVGPCICPPTPSPTPSATCAASPCPPGCFPVAQCACKCLTPTPSPTATPTTTPCPSPTCPPGCFPKVECVGPCICPTPTPTPTPCPACTPTPCPDCTPTPSPTPGGGTATPAPGEVHALNLSTRLLVGTGADVGIGGFIITGTGPRHILLRGIGPSLSGTGVNALSDPVLELHKSDGSTVTNNNWKDAQQQAIEDTGLAPTNDLESAILVDLDPGAYTAILKGNANVVGVGLVELYDLSMNTNSKLANTSTRANVSTGNNIVIAGFILGAGAGTDPIIVRGIGPSLSGVTALANPQLELRNSDGALIRSNNNWMDDPAQVVIIQAAGLAPSNALESAIAETLGPGGYTALLSGVNNGTGLGLVEVYDRPTTPPTPTASPSGTPSPTPSPSSTAGTPTPPPTPTPGPKPCTENFDGVTAPALPPGWVGVWVTTTTMPDSPPNAAFIPDQGGISDQVLDRMNVTVQSASATMTFRNNFNTDTSIGAADGGVLEVSVPSISGGDFLDVTDSHMGGTITAGGYTGVIGGLAGRMGWIGNSGGYINTVITLGPNMVGQTVTLRWHFITAGGHGAPGWWIDNLVFTDAVCP